MMFRFIILLFSIFCNSILFAQDLYEVKFTGDDMTKYKGLLVVFSDQDIYMRIGYEINTDYRVVNVDYVSENINYDNQDYLILVGQTPEFITDKGEFSYNPDHLIFSDLFDLPLTTDDVSDPTDIKEVDSFTSLSKSDISDSYLRQFYGKHEDDYLALKKMYGIDVVEYNYDYGNDITLHLIVIANTKINDIGIGCQVDQHNLESEFEGISNALKIGYKKYIINGNQFTKEDVYSSINNMNVDENDVIICVYRGHGFRWSNQESTWPQLDMRYSQYTRVGTPTSIDLEDLYNLILKKNARLNIILADCCNNDVGLSKVTSNNYLAVQSNNNNYNIHKLNNLFLHSKGNILSCSAAPGEVSWVNTSTGGFYTNSFLQALREEISYLRNDKADWRDLMNNTIINARYKSSTCKSCSIQNGKYYYGVY